MPTPTTPLSNQSWPEICAALEASIGKFPLELVNAIRADWATHGISFIGVLAQAVVAPAQMIAADSVLPSFAIYLAAEARDTRAYPFLLGLTRLPYAKLDEMIGDTICDGLDQALASTCPGDDRVLRELSLDRSLSMYNRLAAIGALVTRAFEGDASQDEIADFLISVATLEATAVVKKSSEDEYGSALEFRSLIVDVLCDLGAGQHWPTIKAWYETGLIDPILDTQDGVERRLLNPVEAEVPHKRYHYIRSAVDEMSWWAMFQKKALRPRVTHDDVRYARNAMTGRQIFSRDGKGLSSFNRYGEPIQLPLVREHAKIGRNDPCTCGSGKKYKKCCGAND